MMSVELKQTQPTNNYCKLFIMLKKTCNVKRLKRLIRQIGLGYVFQCNSTEQSVEHQYEDGIIHLIPTEIRIRD